MKVFHKSCSITLACFSCSIMEEFLQGPIKRTHTAQIEGLTFELFSKLHKYECLLFNKVWEHELWASFLFLSLWGLAYLCQKIRGIKLLLILFWGILVARLFKVILITIYICVTWLVLGDCFNFKTHKCIFFFFCSPCSHRSCFQIRCSTADSQDRYQLAKTMTKIGRKWSAWRESLAIYIDV